MFFNIGYGNLFWFFTDITILLNTTLKKLRRIFNINMQMPKDEDKYRVFKTSLPIE